MQYAPQGAVSQMSWGQKVTQTCFNNRLQPTVIRVGGASTENCVAAAGDLLRLGLNYGTADNNGNVQSQTMAAAGWSATQVYTYDGLNRLKRFTEGGLSRTYDYDRYGNGWVAANSGLPLSPLTPITPSWFDPATNRLVLTGYYDSGNQRQVNPYTMHYDGENRQDSATNGPSTEKYYYDGEGRRVKKVLSNGTEILYLYDAFDRLAAEYQTPGLTGEIRRYIAADHLGSTRLVTDAAGAVKERHDYLPFGEELFAGTGGRTTQMGYLAANTPNAVTQRFTGKERDSETQGLDYFGARYFSGALGRFTSPDRPFLGQAASEPQSWNLYTYGLNNPFAYVDRNGLWPTRIHNEILEAVFGGTLSLESGVKTGLQG